MIESISKFVIGLSVWALTLFLIGFFGRVFWEVMAAGWNLLG